MLARQNRLTRGSDYRMVVRRGIRSGAPDTITSVLLTADPRPARFGFIVSKQVGTAVSRNTVRRRLKAIAATLLQDLPEGADVVVRALPGALTTPFAELQQQVAHGVERSLRRGARV